MKLFSLLSVAADVFHPAHGEGDAVRDVRPGQVPVPHRVGAARPRHTLLRVQEVPHRRPHRSVSLVGCVEIRVFAVVYR